MTRRRPSPMRIPRVGPLGFALLYVIVLGSILYWLLG